MGDLYLLWPGREYLLFRLLPASINLAHAKSSPCRKYGKSTLLFTLRTLWLLSSPLSLIQKCGGGLWDIYKGINRFTRVLSSIFFHFQTLNSSFIQLLFEERSIRRGKTPAPQLHFVCLLLQLGGKRCARACCVGPLLPLQARACYSLPRATMTSLCSVECLGSWITPLESMGVSQCTAVSASVPKSKWE